MGPGSYTRREENTRVSFTTGGVVRVLALLVGVLALWYLRDLLLLVVTAFILASAMLPLANRLEKHGVARTWTVAGVLAVILVGVGSLTVLTAPILAEQLRQLTVHAPQQIGRASAWITAKSSSLTGRPVNTPDLSGEAGQYLRTAAERVVRLTAGAAGAVVALVMVAVLASFMVIDHQRFRAGFLRFVPATAHDLAAKQWDEVQERMGGYVAGMALISVEKAVVLSTALWLIGVPSAFLLGVLSGVLNFIPYFGFWSVFLLAELLAFNVSPMKGLWVFVVFMAHEWLKSGFIGPYLMGRTMKVHPATLLVAIAAGAKLFGVIGTLVAAPLAAAVAVIVTNLLPAPAVREAVEREAVEPA